MWELGGREWAPESLLQEVEKGQAEMPVNLIIHTGTVLRVSVS